MYLIDVQGKCFADKCPVYYFENNTLKTCISCSTLQFNCNNCTVNPECVENGGSKTCDSTNLVLCKSCNPGYYTLVDDNGMLQCIQTVPDGYANINNNLTACTGDCLTCTGYPTNCLSCKTLNFLNFQCLTDCPFSHYSIQTSTPVNTTQVPTLECTRCKPNCNTCFNETFCLSCLIGYYLLESQGFCL